VNGVVDLVLEREKSTAGVTIRGNEVVGTDEHVQYKGKQGLATLPGNAGWRGELGGEVCGVEVI
jgi:hypothetical protein